MTKYAICFDVESYKRLCSLYGKINKIEGLDQIQDNLFAIDHEGAMAQLFSAVQNLLKVEGLDLKFTFFTINSGINFSKDIVQ